MGGKSRVGPSGRFSARYGATIRAKARDIELQMHAPHKCPYCFSRGKLKRLSIGIWKCRKCGRKFTGGAYVPLSTMLK